MVRTGQGGEPEVFRQAGQWLPQIQLRPFCPFYIKGNFHKQTSHNGSCIDCIPSSYVINEKLESEGNPIPDN
jgi:hypothetical protein